MVNKFSDLAMFYAKALKIQYEAMEKVGIPDGVSKDQAYELAEKFTVSILIENYKKQAKGHPGLDLSEITEDLPMIEWVEPVVAKKKNNVSHADAVEQARENAQEDEESNTVLIDGVELRINPGKMLVKKLRGGELEDWSVRELRAILCIPEDKNMSWESMAIEIHSASPQMLADWMKDKGLL